MSGYVIVTDSSCDLDQEMVERLDVQVLPLKFTIRGTTFRDTPDHRDMSSKEFYRLIRSGEMGTTSAVNMQEYLDLLTPILEEGKDVLVLAFSSGLSSTCQAAKMAAEELTERFPERRILCGGHLGGLPGPGAAGVVRRREAAGGGAGDPARGADHVCLSQRLSGGRAVCGGAGEGEVWDKGILLP